MDVDSDYVETTKYNLSFENINYFKSEDSGYHTFTPGSLEHSELTSELFDQSVVANAAFISINQRLDKDQADYVTLEATYRCKQLKPRNENSIDTPPPRRAAKRPFSSVESTKQATAVPTPTTWIAGKIQGLEVTDDKENNAISLLTENSRSTGRNTRYIYRLNLCEPKFSYPITPVKRNCKSNPCKKSGRKLDFSIHSIACENLGLQLIPQQKAPTKTEPTQHILARPDQNIDILRLLNQHRIIPPLKKIFHYLSNEDICKFSSVSSAWKDIWNCHSSNQKKIELRKYLKSAKANQENCVKESNTKIKATKLNDGFLKEIHNEISDNPVSSTPISPQYSPRTNKFRKFIKSASLDSRIQLPCVKCSHPAKVTEEPTGEEWVECTNTTCSYQFCRACNCSRHPGRSCSQYDLNAPSPSKRKKCDYAVGTQKSRKNLRRLLC